MKNRKPIFTVGVPKGTCSERFDLISESFKKSKKFKKRYLVVVYINVYNKWDFKIIK